MTWDATCTRPLAAMAPKGWHEMPLQALTQTTKNNMRPRKKVKMVKSFMVKGCKEIDDKKKDGLVMQILQSMELWDQHVAIRHHKANVEYLQSCMQKQSTIPNLEMPMTGHDLNKTSGLKYHGQFPSVKNSYFICLLTMHL